MAKFCLRKDLNRDNGLTIVQIFVVLDDYLILEEWFA